MTRTGSCTGLRVGELAEVLYYPGHKGRHQYSVRCDTLDARSAMLFLPGLALKPLTRSTRIRLGLRVLIELVWGRCLRVSHNG